MQVVGIKAITGEHILATATKGTTSAIALDSSSAQAQEVVYENLRSIRLIPQPNGQDALLIQPWIFTEPNKKLTEQEWDDLRICDTHTPQQLEAMYLQQVTGIQLAKG